MEFKDIVTNPFVWGLVLGLIFWGMAFFAHLKTKRELKRYQKHLSDKLEIEAQQFELLKKEKDQLKQENENLRLKIGSSSSQNGANVERDLEIYARAEKTMVMNAPGFAPAWETAKNRAMEEIEAEEQGKSLPRRIFRKIFAGGSGAQDSRKNLPSTSDNYRDVESTPEKPESTEKKAPSPVNESVPQPSNSSSSASAEPSKYAPKESTEKAESSATA